MLNKGYPLGTQLPARQVCLRRYPSVLSANLNWEGGEAASIASEIDQISGLAFQFLSKAYALSGHQMATLPSFSKKLLVLNFVRRLLGQRDS